MKPTLACKPSAHALHARKPSFATLAAPGPLPLVQHRFAPASADRTEVAKAWQAEHEACRAVVRWRALYSRCRKRMARMGTRAADRLHYQLKDLEYDAIEVHQATVERLHLLCGISLIAEAGLA